MNCKVLVMLVVICSVMIANSNAWGRLRIRGRRIWDRIKKPICRNACKYTCTTAIGGAAPVCHLGCNKLCGRKRRDASEEDQMMIPLPREFGEYDTNEDGFIQLEELANFLVVEPADVKKAFTVADTNSDFRLSEEEFQAAPWLFDDDADDDDKNSYQ